jgi:hypothetical protein
MEKEDFPCPKPFFLQSANNANHKEKNNPNQAFQNAIATFFFYHNKIFLDVFSLKESLVAFLKANS